MVDRGYIEAHVLRRQKNLILTSLQVQFQYFEVHFQCTSLEVQYGDSLFP